jgi:hypothetical protein
VRSGYTTTLQPRARPPASLAAARHRPILRAPLKPEIPRPKRVLPAAPASGTQRDSALRPREPGPTTLATSRPDTPWRHTSPTRPPIRVPPEWTRLSARSFTNRAETASATPMSPVRLARLTAGLPVSSHATRIRDDPEHRSACARSAKSSRQPGTRPARPSPPARPLCDAGY